VELPAITITIATMDVNNKIMPYAECKVKCKLYIIL